MPSPALIIVIMPPWPKSNLVRHECERCGVVIYTGSRRPPEGWHADWCGKVGPDLGGPGRELCGNCSQPRRACEALSLEAA
ncbi:MAG: hypothetical protein KQI62_02130 [Deltaproteobacteria bacterium]|nr:hypothetical protein [Deltaproteobacteria bacterium]